jgi:hypothetical protein
VFLRVVETRCVFVRLEVRVDEFDESIEVFCCDLYTVRRFVVGIGRFIYSIVFLVKVIDISVEYFNKELDRYCGVHACISDTERTL